MMRLHSCIFFAFITFSFSVRQVNKKVWLVKNTLENIYDFDKNSDSVNQSIWFDISEKSIISKNVKTRYIKKYRILKLDTSLLQSVLKKQEESTTTIRDAKILISLPLPDGSFARFRFAKTETMVAQDNLKESLSIKTFTGQGVDNIYMNVAFETTTRGFHAMITDLDKVIYIEPYNQNDLFHYICYYKHDLKIKKTKPFEQGGPVKH